MMRVFAAIQDTHQALCPIPIIWLLLPFLLFALVRAEEVEQVKDTEPPSAIWVSPRADSTLKDKINLAVKATDNIGIETVIFSLGMPLGKEDEEKIANLYADIDGSGFGEVLGGYMWMLHDILRQGLQKSSYLPPAHFLGEGDEGADDWSMTVDVSRYISGKYTLVAEVVDAAGNSTRVALPVTIKSSVTPPKVTLNPKMTYSEEGVRVSGTVTYNLTEREDESMGGGFPSRPGGGIDTVGMIMLALDDRLLGMGTVIQAPRPRSNKTVAWKGFFLPPPPGEHTVTAVCLDAYGNGGASWQKYTLPLQTVNVMIAIKETKEKEKVAELIALAVGGIKVEYRFLEKEKDVWVVIRDYSPEHRCIRQLARPGDYHFKVEVREVGTSKVVSAEDSFKE